MKKVVRIPVLMSDEEVEALDNWRRQQPAIPSRGEAIREAIRRMIAKSD